MQAGFSEVQHRLSRQYLAGDAKFLRFGLRQLTRFPRSKQREDIGRQISVLHPGQLQRVHVGDLDILPQAIAQLAIDHDWNRKLGHRIGHSRLEFADP